MAQRVGSRSVKQKPSGTPMQIVIPMSGFGERFRRAGYAVPKPLIEVDGKTMVEHVVDLFPDETDITFICNRDHLDATAYDMPAVLERACPTARISAIEPHKLGPVHAVLMACGGLRDDESVIVNYCDFGCYWDYSDFKTFVRESDCAGAIPAYRGFHPHSLGSTYYAYIREAGLWMEDIQEKQPFTDTPFNEFASSGTYYFKSALLMKTYFQRCLDEDLLVNNEYYASMAYRPMVQDGHPVAVYELQHFMQWGTPQDLAEYRRWSDLFRRFAASKERRSSARHDGALLMPMAGLGSRFRKDGYDIPKPVIPVGGVPMSVRAALDMPRTQDVRMVTRTDLEQVDALEERVRAALPDATFVRLNGATDGQARTCLLGLEGLDLSQPLSIAACDNGVLFDAAAFDAAYSAADVLVWGVRGHAEAIRRPTMFSWIDAGADGLVRQVALKTPLSDPAQDPIVVGAFTFRRARDFEACAQRLIARDERVNGEFYVDAAINTAIEQGLTVRLFEVDHYIGWGTPNELRTYEYWQSCFNKWPSHPYALRRDPRVDERSYAELEARYAARKPPRPIGRHAASRSKGSRA